MDIHKNQRINNVVTEIFKQNQGNYGRVYAVMCECEFCFLSDWCPLNCTRKVRQITSCEKMINQYIEKGLI